LALIKDKIIQLRINSALADQIDQYMKSQRIYSLSTALRTLLRLGLQAHLLLMSRHPENIMPQQIQDEEEAMMERLIDDIMTSEQKKILLNT
jgi:Arc/MetJ-type ribon-helix-helix transcriptional regulator